MKYQIYTAGPMSGLKYEDVVNWRKQVALSLEPLGVKVKSPLRGTEHFKDVYSSTGEEGTERSPKEIFIRDRIDCTTADALLVNLTGAPSASIGTVAELAWAHLERIPTVVIKDDKFHNHLFVNECTDFSVNTIEEAIETIKDILDLRG